MKPNRKKIFIVLLASTLYMSCTAVFERKLDDKKLELFAPSNNLITTDKAHIFSWNTVGGATKYQIQIVRPGFDSIATFRADTIVGANSYMKLLDTGSYQWRVRAMNESSSSQFSDSWNLKIQ